MEENEQITHYAKRPNHHKNDDKNDDKFLKIRQVLNIIFIVGAIVGVGTYYWYDSDTGIYIVLGAMVFKFIEVSIRLYPK